MDIESLVAGLRSSGALDHAASEAGLAPNQAQAAVRGMADHVNGGGGAEGMIDAVAARAGLDPAQVQAFLPHVLPLLQQHAQATAGGAQGEFGSLLGSLSAMAGSAGGGGGGGLAGMAGGLLGGRI